MVGRVGGGEVGMGTEAGGGVVNPAEQLSARPDQDILGGESLIGSG